MWRESLRDADVPILWSTNLKNLVKFFKCLFIRRDIARRWSNMTNASKHWILKSALCKCSAYSHFLTTRKNVLRQNLKEKQPPGCRQGVRLSGCAIFGLKSCTWQRLVPQARIMDKWVPADWGGGMFGGDDYTAAKYGYRTNTKVHTAPIHNAHPQHTGKRAQ